MPTTAPATQPVPLQAALDAAEAAYATAHPASAEYYRRSTASMPGGNTRTVIHFSPFPLMFTAGHDTRLTDADGKTYLDFMGEYTAALYGHSDPTITAALRRALDNGLVRGGASDCEAALAHSICDRFPAIDRVRFCNSGTEANLYALSAARALERAHRHHRHARRLSRRRILFRRRRAVKCTHAVSPRHIQRHRRRSRQNPRRRRRFSRGHRRADARRWRLHPGDRRISTRPARRDRTTRRPADIR